MKGRIRTKGEEDEMGGGGSHLFSREPESQPLVDRPTGTPESRKTHHEKEERFYKNREPPERAKAIVKKVASPGKENRYQCRTKQKLKTGDQKQTKKEKKSTTKYPQ